jgi:dienelactone hydrolase
MACSQCFTGAVHTDAEPQGRLEEIYGYKTYITGDVDQRSESAILYLPDFFSLQLVNNKLLADRYAKETGCKVLIPDIVPGAGAHPGYLAHMDIVMDPNAGILSKIWAILNVLPLFPKVMMGKPAPVMPEIIRIARAMKKDLPKGGKLGVCGFCWGGYGAVNLMSVPTEEGGSTPLIDASFTGHPSFMTMPDMFVDNVKAFKVPLSAAIAETDNQVNEKLALEAEAELREKVGSAEENRYEIKIYKGAVHGFCVRNRPSVQVEAEASETAAKQAVEWFKKYLN